ncbi:hypothetical protein [Saccharopolyspora shandongensis]|uniref:hypothetical protein n=1 Tax=Saccharopolyspora shandongensis TaxID=418495 RepID=UPI0033F6DBDF
MEGVITAARELPAKVAEDVMTAAKEACTNGLNTIRLACAAIIVLTMLRNRRAATPSGEDAPQAKAAEDSLPTA